jgi:Kelch motif
MHRRHHLQSIFLVLACGSIAAGQSAGTFIATGSMITPRFGHTATLLVDGRVLIAGGYTDTWNPLPYPVNGPAVTATAELYDPATGVFTPTGSMITPRAYHTATLLPDGRVLIAAGRGAGRSEDNLASVEIYDPTSGVFAATASLSTPSSNDNNTATLLLDGRVLIIGEPATVNGSFRAEIYDPSTAAFTPAANSTQPPAFAAANLLPSGQVLLASAVSSELYDPASAAFSPTGALFAFWNQTALLANGAVLAVGGDDDWGASAGASVYDPVAGASSPTARMTAPRAHLTITLLPDSRVLITGGSTWTGFTTPAGLQGMIFDCCLASSETYDPAAGLFSATGNMISARAGHTATLLPSGKILIVGGGSGDNSPALATAELCTPAQLIAAPALFSISGDGRGQEAIWHAISGAPASATNPAVAGEILSMYTNNLIDGGVIPPQVAVSGRLAEILYFGPAPGYPGYYQVNFRMQSGVASGLGVPVCLNYLSRPSNEVTIAVQ